MGEPALTAQKRRTESEFLGGVVTKVVGREQIRTAAKVAKANSKSKHLPYPMYRGSNGKSSLHNLHSRLHNRFRVSHWTTPPKGKGKGKGGKGQTQNQVPKSKHL